MAKNTIQHFESIRIVGGLLGSKVLADSRFYKLDGQTPADYGVEKGLKLNDELSRYWRIAQTRWQEFQQQRVRTDISQRKLAQEDWLIPLLEKVLGYEVEPTANKLIGEREFPITHTAHNHTMPLVLCGADKDLDKGDAVFGQEGRKRSPMGLAQEYLNAETNCLWAIVSNGTHLRLLRDNPAMTRPAYIEVDFARLFDEDNYADFATLWLLMHATRITPRDASAEKCWLETWRAKSLNEGERIVEKLRWGVADALRELGTGFVAHAENAALRAKLDSGELTKEAYFQQVLRLVYRLLFLLTAEDREIALLRGDEHKVARTLYEKGYSLNSLRERARLRRNRDQYGDAWQQLLINFSGFANGQPSLAQPALGGLFAVEQCPDIDACQLQNRYLYSALFKLCYFEQGSSLSRINYRDMNTEEFGSVYEALLELTPQLHTHGQWSFSFQGDAEGEQSASGNARKLSGAYYTPDPLVQELIKSALLPVIADRLNGKHNQAEKRAAILSISVCDPACGSGHFLLGAARRLAAELAQIDADSDQPTEQHYRHALRDVLANCIFGVDRNPMSVELAKVAMWIEGVEPGKALSFLDHHIVCGDALLGIMDFKQLEKGIPSAAFKPLSGDDKTLCAQLSKTNKQGIAAFQTLFDEKQTRDDISWTNAASVNHLLAIESMPSNSVDEVLAKQRAYDQLVKDEESTRLKNAANIFVGAFLLPKNTESLHIATSQTLYLELFSESHNTLHQHQVVAAKKMCKEALVLHWPLTFPQVFAKGGFDCVLGNPPWEVSQLGEEEYFSARDSEISALSGVNRKKAILILEKSNPLLWSEYVSDKRKYESANCFYRESGRFPLSAVGKINTYPLFSETIGHLTSLSGQAGFIVPSGIATDDSNKYFFASIVDSNRLICFLGFDNEKRIFPSVHPDTPFALVTLGYSQGFVKMAHYILSIDQISDSRRIFSLDSDAFKLMNPNTLTCPIFRSNKDADLASKIYRKIPVLIEESRGVSAEINPWGISFRQGLFNMTSDSGLFESVYADDSLPLYEAKMIHQYDHRWATYTAPDSSRDCSIAEKQNENYFVTPRYWVNKVEVQRRLSEKKWDRNWLLGFRDITNATNERTVISNVIPIAAVGNQMPLIFPKDFVDSRKYALLVGNLAAIVLDFIARHKVGGTHLNFFLAKQLPILSPELYVEKDIDFISCRVLELTYTSRDMQSWAKDLGYSGEAFAFDPDRRAIIRAELDAYYAKLYGLTRDELRYILDPADIMGQDYPSETFRVLKNKELKEFGEYRTQKLVMREFDRLTLAEANGDEYASLLVPPPGQKSEPVYADVGVLRDKEDAQLAGIIWAVIAAGNVSQVDIRGILEMLKLPQALDIYISQESLPAVKQLLNKYQLLFSPERIDHANTIVSHFKRQTWVRTDSQGVFSVSTDRLPEGIQPNQELTALAEHLLVAVKAIVQTDQQQPGVDTETSSKSA